MWRGFAILLLSGTALGQILPPQIDPGIDLNNVILNFNTPFSFKVQTLLGTAGATNCYTKTPGTSGVNPTATVPGTCDGGATHTYTSPVSITGTAVVCFLATQAAQTNSPIQCTPYVLPPFFPAAGTYAFGTMTIQLSSNQGTGANIYTTDGSNPSITGSCVPAGTSTSLANGSTFSLTASHTVKFAPCTGSSLGSVQTAIYTIRSPLTWYIRPNGGTPTQCTGNTDADYSGAGSAQPCALNDFSWMYLTGAFGVSQWLMAGGETVVIRGCTASAQQGNPSNPNCRVGEENANATGRCTGISAFWGCSPPPIPMGGASQHTKILGACASGVYSCNPVKTNPTALGWNYTSNLTQIFGGFGTNSVFYTNGSTNIDIEGIEITTHNGACSRVGSPHYPNGCSTSVPLSDYAQFGIEFASNNDGGTINLQDVWIHGMSEDGIAQNTGGHIVLTRVASNFNAFAGWNMDDGTSMAAGTIIDQSYVTMIGNGCMEQYPITNPQFAALACWDTNSGGFGDSWSGGASTLEEFTCDHCNISYNTKDGGIGPHMPLTGNPSASPSGLGLSLTNSIWSGNMGQAGKWAGLQNTASVVQNNLFLGNCVAFSEKLTGAVQNFDIGTGLGGSYLSGYCRAAGDLFDFFTYDNSSFSFTNNTVVTYQPTIFQGGCVNAGTCSTYTLANNIFLGYTSSYTGAPFTPGQAPGLSVMTGVTPVSNHNIEFNISGGDTCGVNNIICSDPLFVGEPAQGFGPPPESTLFGYNFHITGASPARSAGTAPAPTTDFFGVTQTIPPTLGASVFSSVVAPTLLQGVILRGVVVQ